eukprot:TRINITY_DN19154_c0_g1_i1.p1 TRINITY_DN19154_c0_g1~~TRINITY_DN19154_c0_g1_i1.p1  ORF type:complete len:193 (+),score=22.71 TRINITY_DN19154_c0_g1_i1:126-704(+)
MDTGSSSSSIWRSACLGGCGKPSAKAGDSPSVSGLVNTLSNICKRRLPRRSSSSRSTTTQRRSQHCRDWWTSTSADEMSDLNGRKVNGQESASNQQQSANSSVAAASAAMQNATGSATPETFVNHALVLWNERRREWVGTAPRQRMQRDPVISVDATYEDLLTTSRPFPQPVPLPEMVDFLVDVWDQDGLYD